MRVRACFILLMLLGSARSDRSAAAITTIPIRVLARRMSDTCTLALTKKRTQTPKTQTPKTQTPN